MAVTLAKREESLGPGEWLTVAEVMELLGISRSGVEKLKRHVRWSRRPVTGVRFVREDILGYQAAGLTAPTAGATRRPRGGTSVASDDDEVLPGGMTRGELRRQVGF